MSEFCLKILPLGDRAAVVRFGACVDRALNARAHAFCAALADARPKGVIEWAPAFASVTLWHDPDILPFDRLAVLCEGLVGAASALQPGALHELPFCVEGDFAPDLGDVATRNGLSPQAWLDAFTGLTFDVYMLGFLPGFAYLGALPKELDAPRLATPRARVPERSVAVADGMCAAYPFASPGGWNLVGRTPVRLFDANGAGSPALLAPGDRVRWRLIDGDAFESLEAQWRD